MSSKFHWGLLEVVLAFCLCALTTQPTLAQTSDDTASVLTDPTTEPLSGPEEQWPISVRVAMGIRAASWAGGEAFEDQLAALGHGDATALRTFSAEAVVPLAQNLAWTVRAGIHSLYWARARPSSTYISDYDLLLGLDGFLELGASRLGVQLSAGGSIAGLRFVDSLNVHVGGRAQIDAYWSYPILERARLLVQLGFSYNFIPGVDSMDRGIQLGGFSLGCGLEFGRE